jgi:hypothetical protein
MILHMLEHVGDWLISTFRCKECGWQGEAKTMPERCPNSKCRRLANPKPNTRGSGRKTVQPKPVTQETATIESEAKFAHLGAEESIS